MKWPLIVLAVLTGWGSAQAQIYRCDTATGVEFSEEPCGESAEVVQLEESTSGINGGPPEEVVEELAEKKAQRAEDREKRLEAAARAPRYLPNPSPQVIVQQQGYYPGYLWGPNRPHKPNRPVRPPYQRPPPPRPQPVPPSNGGNMVLKPLR